jgi:hypothetical protein
MIAITLLTTAAALAAEPVGSIVSLSGKATATEQNGTVRTLELKSPVFLNDQIKTEAGSSLQMMFLDESVLSVGEQSEMTIDEYVYNPDRKEDNACTFSLVKGVFRAVTARITALNPDRFTVKTRLATIGIRGCEVAFTVTERGVNVYVISLPDGKNIVITLNAGVDISGFTSGDGCTIDADNLIRIIQAGIMVQIEEDGGATRLLTPEEIQELIEEIEVSYGDDQGSDGDSSNQQNHLNGLEGNEPAPPSNGNGGGSSSDSSSSSSPSAVYTVQGGGTDWEWGIWAIPGQTPEKVDFIGHQILTAADVQTLYGGTPYSGMAGIGSSAAIITHNGVTYYVSGQCNVSVNIGTSTANNWMIQTLGSPATDGLGTSLGYNITGIITAAGALQPNGIGSVDYSLTVGGTTYDGLDIDTQTIDANLTGVGTTTFPSGIIGHFNITHDGGATTVLGGFGSDLSPP